jgi:transaldolase
MGDAGMDALAVVGQMQQAIDVYRSNLEILAASVRDPQEIETLADLGVSMVTLPIAVLRRLAEPEQAAAAAAAFLEDARAIQ